MFTRITLLSTLALAVATASAQSAPAASSQPPQQETVKRPPLTAREISQLRTKAEAGESSAQTTLGQAYLDGKVVPQSDELAVKWFRKAADQGDADAENSLGVMYRMGQGVARDKEEAVRWYQKAAKQGNPKAMFNLGAAYYNGDGVAADDVASHAWFLLAHEAGSPAADEAVRRSESEGKEEPGAAFAKVGLMYETGVELPKNSIEALKWYRKAADAADPEAEVKVAAMLLASSRTPTQDEYAEAHRRCEDAAAKRYSPGAYCLVLIYRRGIGVTKDQGQTLKWLDRAADLGYARALLELGEAYWKGDGVKADLVKAYSLIWIANNSKVSGADQDEESLRKEMNSKQVEQAKKKADEWSRNHRILVVRDRTTKGSPQTK